MRKRFYFILTVLIVFCVQAVPVSAAEGPKIAAEAAIVIDADTGDVLYQKKAREKREPASTTKIMTGLLALEHLDPDEEITVTGNLDTMGNVIKLKQGEVITVENLLYGLLVHSANDAANVLAIEIGGTQENFAKMMTKRAKQCGAKNTKFLNPNGLNWAWQPDHLTTAYDLAVIAKEAMKNSTFRKIVSTKKYFIPATNKAGTRKLINTNRCLWDKKSKIKVNGKLTTPYVEGSMGIKTGLTSTAGSCFVGEVNHNGTKLISVILGSGDLTRFSDTKALWEYCINQFYDTHDYAKKGEALEKVRVHRGAIRNVETVAEQDASVTILSGKSRKSITAKFIPQEVYAPINKGETIGTFVVYNGNQLVSSTAALAAEAVEKGGPLSYFGIPDLAALFIYIFAGLVIVIIIIARVMSVSRRRKRRLAKKARDVNKRK